MGCVAEDSARPERRRLGALTVTEILARAAEFAAKANADDTRGFARDAYHRLAIRYAALATMRKAEEGRPARH
jgi:hypothetical protein